MDRIDLRMLQLLRQRSKLSARIGAAKRRHGAVVYVPERERELMARLLRLSKGRPSTQAVAAVYREILSSSRAEQGQGAIGLLQASADVVLPAGRKSFGACDRFAPGKSWRALVKGFESGVLSLALLTGAELAAILVSASNRREFADKWFVAGEIAAPAKGKPLVSQRIFIITPRPACLPRTASRILILIECKSTVNAIKSLLHAMPEMTFHAELLGRTGAQTTVALLKQARSGDASRLTRRVFAAGKTAGLAVTLLGIYPAIEDYGG